MQKSRYLKLRVFTVATSVMMMMLAQSGIGELYAQNQNVTTPKDCTAENQLGGACLNGTKSGKSPRKKRKNKDIRKKKIPNSEFQSPPSRSKPGGPTPGVPADDLPVRPDDKF
jgi:hypothetical protein